MRISAATLMPQQPRIPVIQRTQSPLSQSASSQSSSPIPPAHLQDSDWNTTDEWDTPASQIKTSPSPVPSTLTMTKEAKAAEMARRKEERKQVIRILAPEKCKLIVYALAHCHVERTEESSDKDVNRIELPSASHTDYISRPLNPDPFNLFGIYRFLCKQHLVYFVHSGITFLLVNLFFLFLSSLLMENYTVYCSSNLRCVLSEFCMPNKFQPVFCPLQPA